MLDWNGTGCSVMEVSHRGKEYDALHHETMDLFRELAGMGPEWKVLFTTGGASTQFLMLPTNYLGDGKQADYIHTGNWSKAAIKEAKRFGTITHPANMELEGGLVPLHTQAGRAQVQSRCRVCALHQQQHHLRHPVALHPQVGASPWSATCPPTSSAAPSTRPLQHDLCRSPEEPWPLGRHGRGHQGRLPGQGQRKTCPR
jgi:hypothetical protein